MEMAPDRGIPILIRSKHASLAKALAENLAPEYDVVHICITHHTSLYEIPSILKGRLVTPFFTGSNLYRAPVVRRKPVAVVFDASISKHEIEDIKRLSEMTCQDVKFVMCQKKDVLKCGFPVRRSIGRAMRKSLKEAGV
ncbi:MAG: hypothetical protein M1820_001769 [Bogoriella megaspora]|nr:MAG: hypothetical protein M1820_001769 [Bogoriella megaspora]